MKKKLLLFMMMLFALLGISIISPESSVNVQAEEVQIKECQTEAGNFSYVISKDGTVAITKYTEVAGVTEIQIPSEIDEKSVTIIEFRAFANCSSLKSIKIPSSVTTIVSSAFYNCSKLENIEIPSSVTTIGSDAFFGTAWLAKEREKNPLVIVNGILIDGKTATGAIKIPDTVTIIGPDAFGGCRSLKSVEIPKSVTTIGFEAFFACDSLERIEIADSVTTIEGHAFQDCKSLKSIEIPNSITTIEKCVFSDCSSLENVKIPLSVTTIGEIAFSGCDSLKNIEIPSSVTTIGNLAFNKCINLKSIKIGDSVTTIGGAAFIYCRSLKSVEIPSSVTTIEGGAFQYCSSLESIEIPKSVTTIGDGVLYECSSFKDVYYGGSKEEWKLIGIGKYNDELLAANIHYNSSMPDNELDKIKLSKTSMTYTGKECKPLIEVTDTNGKKVSASNYKVVFSNNKNVGQAKVTVTGKGNYMGTVTAKFNIVPKGTSLSKTTAKKKSFDVKWKKQIKETTGYEIQYSTSKKFQGAKITAVKKNETTSVTIKKLKAKKKYYVRIRTYKTVKVNGKSKKFYSEWSKAKTVTTKK